MTQQDKDSVKLQARPNRPTGTPPGEKTSREAMPILELRRFLADELDGSPVDGDFGRSFTPLTDGLGIAPPAPKPAEVATKAAMEARALDARKNFFDTDPIAPAPKAPTQRELPVGTVAFGHDDSDSDTLPGDGKAVTSDRAAVLAALGGSDRAETPAPLFRLEEEAATPAPVAPKPTPVVSYDEEDLTPTERVAAERYIDRAALPEEPRWSGERIFLEEEDPRKVEVPKPMTMPELESERDAIVGPPPPMPDAGAGRRLLAAVLDQAFILTLWGITLTITSAVLGGGIPTSFEGLAAGLRKEPVFWRFAILSFATLWLTHFAIGLGLVDRTFGMWVWGLKVRAFGNTDDSSFFRRLSRIVLSFFFYAPVAPALLLMPRYKGRNLLDWMTGTALYRTLE